MSTEADDRRNDGGQRIPFEALVVVDEKGDATYECEAVDVSENGIHLRTAYLPDLGKELTFRFDGGTGEIVAAGNVVWRDEQAKGGEFGVRFSNLDDKSLAALRGVCGLDVVGGDAEPVGAPAERGARVKLHIEGLASPMRARVRDSQKSEVMVGSNLDFLKVGRSIDLEDVEAGKKRLATIDRVEVEIDKETRVPQLVVTLRYGDGPAPAAASSAPTKKETPAVKKAEADFEADGIDDDKKSALDAFVDKAKGVAADLGPRFAAMTKSTKASIESLIAKAKKHRADDGAEDDKPQTKRVTSPPPTGALRASGKTVTRGDKDEPMNDDIDLEETDATKEKQKKRAKIFAASAAGFLVIMLAVFGLRSKSAPPGSEATASNDGAPAAAPPALPAAAMGAASGDAVTANVPLFGPTPMSTTEAAAPPVDPKAAAAAPPADDADDKGEAGDTKYGKGTVSNPKVAKLKFDSPLTELKGTTSKHSVVVFVPGHRNVEPASPLSKRDKRLASVKAVPKDGGVEVTYTFKDDPPPFEAKIDGKLLVMEMGDADEASAKKGGKKKNKAVAKTEKKKEKKKAKKKKTSDD